jgi:hypothetical protein
MAFRRLKMRKDRDWLDYATLAALVGATIAAVIASYVQHSDTDAALKLAAQANALSRETAEKQAKTTASALELSKQSADAAAKAVETSVASERARLFIIPSFAQVNEKDPSPKMSFQIANVGRTSALVTEVTYDCKLAANAGVLQAPSYEPKNTHSAMNIISAGTQYSPSPDLICVMEIPLTDQDYIELAKNHSLIVFRGFVKFLDVFGNTFTKHFGFYNFGKGTGFFPLAPTAGIYNEETKDQ